MASKRTVVGIDLGTTNSCVAFIENGEPVVIPNPEGSRTTPSVVGFSADGERRVGQIAKRQQVTNAENTVFAVKRIMGRRFESEEAQKHTAAVSYNVVPAANGDAWVSIGDKQYSPPEISALVLQSMKATAEAYLGREVSEVVVTVPAYFDDAQRQATRDAAQIAGLDAKRIINEPTAAALAFGFGSESNKRIAVYDLGGGTFDISILDIADGVFSVLATNGDTHLGGEDFDGAIVNHAAERFLAETGIELRRDRMALQRLKEQAEKAKHELSSSLETEINLPFIASDATGPKHLVLTLKRSELELMVADLVDRTLEPCRKALADAGVTAAEIDEVVLVGGMTRMPIIQQRVTEFFGKKPHKGVNPDEAVAVGAALQGAALAGEVDQILLLDVTPLSLGVETGGGIFHRLIPRNTTIPTQVKEIFTTSIDNQSFVPIHVLQGERDMAADNRTLARFELAPILPAPRGVPQIEVTFNIDANGITDVHAKDLATGREQSIRVVVSSGLSQEQIDEIIQDSERYRDSDNKRKEFAELQNAAAAMIYTSERALEECKTLASEEQLQAVENDIRVLKNLVEGGADAISIREAVAQLEHSAFSLAESMYASSGSVESSRASDTIALPAESQGDEGPEAAPNTVPDSAPDAAHAASENSGS
jgi:molecular chaperone DnaK